MIILGIESSCDETAASIVEDGHHILSNVVVSQIDIFKAYGGVIPEVAARSHLEAILPVIHKALDDAFPNLPENQQWQHIDAIAVTHAPGLLGSLLIGTLAARTLAILHNKPFYPVHHLKSHIYATWLSSPDLPIEANVRPNQPRQDIANNNNHPTPSFPLLALVISGGHTQIIHMQKHNDFKIIGTTRDDAVGECFDKIAKILGLPYPGGPSISNAALGHITLQDGTTMESAPGNRHKYHFPHPKLTHPPRSNIASTSTPPNSPCLDFSFSGLKTAVLRAVQSELHLPISFPSHQLPTQILSLDSTQNHPNNPIHNSPFNHLNNSTLNSQSHHPSNSTLDPSSNSPHGVTHSHAAHFIADFSASFEQTAIDILLENLQTALSIYPDTQSIIIAGGVSANSLLRKEATKQFNGKIFFPNKQFSGDNAAMVASAAYYEAKSSVQPNDPYKLTLLPRTPIN